MKKKELKEKLRPLVEELMRESFVKFIREGLIEDTVKDMLLEGGVLKSIVSEVAQGMGARPAIVNEGPYRGPAVGQKPTYTQHQSHPQPQNEALRELERDKENFKKNFRLDHTQNQFVPDQGDPRTFQETGALSRLKNNPMFEGTTPLNSPGRPTPTNQQFAHKPQGQRLKGSGQNASIDVLAGVAPDDSGVDIRKFLSERTESSWVAHAENITKKN